MNRFAPWLRTLVVLGLLTGAVYLAFRYWPQKSVLATEQGDWTCSMHPQIRSPKPGDCPICGMKLIPVKEQQAEASVYQERIGLETEAISYRELAKVLRTVGKLDYNEPRIAYITARIAGRVDKLYADFTGIQVKQGDHLVDIYSPELFVAQGELIRMIDAVQKAQADRTYFETTLEASRAKLRLLGILPEQIESIEKSRKIQTHLTLYSPIGGTVVEKSVRVGQYVKEGDPLYRIADLDPIWLYIDVYESDLSWVRYGQSVQVSLEAYPNEAFQGTVTFIDPFLDDKSRTVKVRVNLKNPDRRLKPAMYASAIINVRLRSDGSPEATGLEGKHVCPMHPEVIQDKPGKCTICQMPLERIPDAKPSTLKPDVKQAPTKSGETVHDEHAGHDIAKATPPVSVSPQAPQGKVLAIPVTAVLDTGVRRIVYRLKKDGAYELVEVIIGPKTEGKNDANKVVEYYPVLSGLKAGDRVVVRGGFLLDSQQQIAGMPSLLYPQGQSAANLHSGHGGGAPTPAKPTTPKGHEGH
jgi:Cu(I)/Ag(I) efflux system membrane fusion protein